jgi:ComF family protein
MRLSHALAGALDVVLPPHCMACRAPVEGPGRLCAECWAGADFIAPPFCAACGLPFDYDPGAGAVCGGCAGEPPAFDRARSVLRYATVARRLVVGLKHRDRTHLAPALGTWLARTGVELVAEAELVVPVPLHRARLIARRFNQAALLARALARKAGLEAVADALVRRKPTRPQAGLTRAQRRLNVAGAFAVPARRRALIEGRRVVLVDDVLTTGATVGACSRALRRGGAAHIDVLTLARVVRTD